MSKKRERPRYFKAHRKHRHLTLDQVAERTGLSTSTISLLERSKRDYSEETLYALAEAYGCDVADLFRPPNPPKNELAEFVMNLDQAGQKKAIRVLKAAMSEEDDAA